MRILLLSAYDAVSHRYWREGMVAALPEHDWTVLTLPPRFFSWRIRGNSLSWAVGQQALLEQGFDMVLATSMVDLATLRGLVPGLATTPSVVYFHENQFAYPRSSVAHTSIEPQMVNLYSALAAQRIVFNSDYNRQSFFSGVSSLLAKMPDAVPADVVSRLSARAQVIPVPLGRDVFEPSKSPKPEVLTLVWNHRWEYDKAPEIFFQAVQGLAKQGVEFRIHLLGQQFREVPALFSDMRETLKNQIETWGWVASRENYLDILRRSHLAVSTARHDFQGLAVLEAVASGCIPVVPNRLAYPEWFGESFRYASTDEDSAQEVQALTAHLAERAAQFSLTTLPEPPELAYLSWDRLRSAYQLLFEELV